jgi:hypothetical protein
LILKPGELLHIPKGCYHAFRKAGSEEQLDQADCHYTLRSQLHAEIAAEVNQEKLCVSVAYDWLFSGCSPEGMRREALWSWRTCQRNRRNTGVKLCSEEVGGPTEHIKSLAQTELSLLFLASTNSGIHRVEKEALGPILITMVKRQLESIAYAKETEALQKELFQSVDKAKDKQGLTKYDRLCHLVTVEKNMPDTIHNPNTPGHIDVAGLEYECNYCGMELANSYFHCNVS